MPRVTTIQTNFTAGEISPQLRGRTDLKHYFNGVKKLRNNVVKPQGGSFKRPGTIFAAEVRDSNKSVLLVEFEYSDIQAYLLEFGENYIRFFKNGVQILTTFMPFVPVEVVTTYTESQLPNLKFAQSADVLYITHPSVPPMELHRLSDTIWQWVPYVNIDGPYLATDNTTQTTITVSNVIDSATIESDANDFAPGDVGKFIEYVQNGKKLLATISAYVDAKHVTVTPLQNVLDTLDPTAVFSYSAPTLTSSAEIFSVNNVGSYIRRDAGAWHLIDSITSTSVIELDPEVALVTTTGSLLFKDRVITCDAKASAALFVATDVNRHLRLNFLSTQIWGKIKTFVDTRNVTVSLDSPIPDKQKDPRDPSPGVGNATATVDDNSIPGIS